jgi:hypothetical protein
MHRSRLIGVIVDCPRESFAAGVRFWAGALGATATPEPGESRFVRLNGVRGALEWLAQPVAAEERAFHLDFETDDVEAEVRRLEALGARRKRLVRGVHWVMVAPTGHELCVLPVQTPDWPAGAIEWPTSTPVSGA